MGSVPPSSLLVRSGCYMRDERYPYDGVWLGSGRRQLVHGPWYEGRDAGRGTALNHGGISTGLLATRVCSPFAICPCLRPIRLFPLPSCCLHCPQGTRWYYQQDEPSLKRCVGIIVCRTRYAYHLLNHFSSSVTTPCSASMRATLLGPVRDRAVATALGFAQLWRCPVRS